MGPQDNICNSGEEYVAVLNEVPGVLSGDLGFAALLEYYSIVRSDFGDNRILMDLSLRKDHVLGGFNFYSAVLMNQRVIGKHGLRIVSPAEAGQRPANPRTYDECSAALVLRPSEYDDRNRCLAEDIAEQVKSRGRNFSYNCPIMIPLGGLDLKKDCNLPKGIGFKIREDCELIDAPQLCGLNHGRTFIDLTKEGLPVFCEKKPRNFLEILFNRVGKSEPVVVGRGCYTSHSGLTGFAFNSSGNLYASQTYLDFSPPSNCLFYVKENS